MVVTPHLHEWPSPAPLQAAETAIFPVRSSLRHANQRPRPTRWSFPQPLPLHRCWLWLTVTSDLRRCTASPTHANSTGLLQEASEKKERRGWREGRERRRSGLRDGSSEGRGRRGWAGREMEQKREGPLKEVRAFWSLKWREVEGGRGSRLGRLQSTAQHWGLKTFLSLF